MLNRLWKRPKTIFKDRQEAGKLLAEKLQKLRGQKQTLVLAIPRGGVVVAHQIAKKLNLSLDIIITRKIGAPHQPELALGAVDHDGNVLWDEQLLKDFGLSKNALKNLIDQQLEEIKRREQVYRKNRPPLNVSDKIIVLIDDGIATGSTILSAINYLKRNQAKKIILAVPVVETSIAKSLETKVDELITLHTPNFLGAVGNFYQNFQPTLDQEVIQLLNYE